MKKSVGVDQAKLRKAQELMAEAFGEDSEEALENSADRFARWQSSALSDARKAYEPGKVKLYPIPANSAVEMITIKATAYSSCEHHYAPAWLKATLGYQPNKDYAGYSKIVKMFRYFACKYTMDERICNDFLRELNATVRPKGAGIILRGKHYCVISRGGNESDFPMMSALTGTLKTDANLRREFYQHATTSWEDGV